MKYEKRVDQTVKRARGLRRDASRAERICWEIVRARRMDGIKFRRQHPIGPYFADIACVAKKLVIESMASIMPIRPKQMHVARQ